MGSATSEIDGVGAVRDEDAFDVETVRQWLADHGCVLEGPVEVRQFIGGASNLTHSLRAGDLDLILRRPPAGKKAKGAHDVGREFRIQEGLAHVFPLVPRLVALCEVGGWSRRFGAARTHVVGVLDWELATVGDSLMDLGSTLAYWVTDDDELFRLFRMQPTNLPGILTRPEVQRYYSDRTGLSASDDDWLFYEVFGLSRLAVIAQQTYYRYHHGQTTDERYAQFGPAARYLETRCRWLAGLPEVS